MLKLLLTSLGSISNSRLTNSQAQGIQLKEHNQVSQVNRDNQANQVKLDKTDRIS
jgi:hypothetical protein